MSLHNKNDKTNSKVQDLLAAQIKYNCKLGLPEGLNDLMCDITREVLRNQPRNLYKFIADYLSAMLVTRDNLSIAAAVCKDLCNCHCEPELRHELEDLGLDDEDVKKASKIILKYFEEEPINETVLLQKLIRETGIDESMLPSLQTAIRVAYMRHQANHTTIYESSSDFNEDEVMSAAKHTIRLYKKTAPTKQTLEIIAEKIQSSYRAYGVTRNCEPKDGGPKPQTTKSEKDKSVAVLDSRTSDAESTDNGIYDEMVNGTSSSTQSFKEINEQFSHLNADVDLSSTIQEKRVATVSSTGIAGSLLTLPTHKPYSAYDDIPDVDEIPEKEHAHIDYTAEKPHVSLVEDDKVLYKSEGIYSSDKVNVRLKGHDDKEAIDDDESQTETFFCKDVMRVESDNYDGDAEAE